MDVINQILSSAIFISLRTFLSLTLQCDEQVGICNTNFCAELSECDVGLCKHNCILYLGETTDFYKRFEIY
jgi:hypothetical protein